MEACLGVGFPPVYSQALRGDGDGEVYQGESGGADGEISQSKVNFSSRHQIYCNWTNSEIWQKWNRVEHCSGPRYSPDSDVPDAS